MLISRLRVTGGFLAELDVPFSPGLNVIIGPRGAGKTTLLELVRHALGVAHADARREDAHRRFIAAVLGSGDVVVDLEGATEAYRLVVDAAGGGRRPEFASAALMLGQNELESIASSPASRLALIDLRAQVSVPTVTGSAVHRLTAELAEDRHRLQAAAEQLSQGALLAQDLAALQQEEARLLTHASDDLTAQRAALRGIEDQLLRTQNEARRVVEAEGVASEVLETARRLEYGLEQLGGLANPTQVTAAEAIPSLIRLSQGMAIELSQLAEALQLERASLADRELQLRGEAEPLRAGLEAAERGLGDVTSRLRLLQGQLAQLEAVRADANQLARATALRVVERDRGLDAAEAEIETAYEARKSVADSVSRTLGNSVTVVVEHLADPTPLREFLMRRLQRSGLKYAALAEAISRTVLPRQLLRQVEAGDFDGLAASATISVDRAARVIEQLQEPEALAELAALHLDDRVDFMLRDGGTQKSVEELSTGQKCAVTLPILMTENGRTLVMDQPEDHLDNAYLVENIVQGLVRRSAVPAQTIVASHNANVPVLGSADRVVVLASDGRRGYVRSMGPFDNPDVVTAITTLMEGGREAFARRAEFYREHGSVL